MRTKVRLYAEVDSRIRNARVRLQHLKEYYHELPVQALTSLDDVEADLKQIKDRLKVLEEINKDEQRTDWTDRILGA